MPDRKSFTSVCAPKPSATPMTPALASSGAMLTPSCPRMMSSARLTMLNVVMLRSSWAIASNRCSRRALMSTAVSSCVPSTPRA